MALGGRPVGPLGGGAQRAAPLGPPTGNRLLDGLEERERSHLLARAMHGVDRPMRVAAFAIDAVYSVVVTSRDGRRSEAATVGCEGMIGISLFLGLDVSPDTVLCQIPGRTVRIPGSVLREAAERGSGLDRMLRRYVAYALRSAEQSIHCNTMHDVEQRACRWLLMTRDRAPGDEFLLTHEFLAEMLGVRRQSVSLVAAMLQRAGLIRYRRGRVVIVDRTGLEAKSCECYAALQELYARLMG